MAFRKSIQMKCLIMLQLQTLLVETETVLNSRPLVSITERLNGGRATTPAHFLSPNMKTGTHN